MEADKQNADEIDENKISLNSSMTRKKTINHIDVNEKDDQILSSVHEQSISNQK